MSNLPLAKKLSEDNLFSQLNLPLSSKWPDIKKAYDHQVKVLKSAIDATKDGSRKAEHEQKLKRLNTAYQAFSQRLSEENANVHQTKEALKSVGLSETANWDKVTKRFDEIRQNQPEQAATFQPQMDILQKNRTYLEPNAKLGKRTFLTAALVLGAAGVSWAAYSHLSQEEKENALQATEQENASGAFTEAGIPLTDTALVDEATLEQYIVDNTTFEDEILSLLGILPSPTISLSLQYKMQVFSSLAKSV